MRPLSHHDSDLRPRPELELLLACARARRDEETSNRIAALARQPLDWEVVMQAAQQHHVRPLLYWQLSQACPDSPPLSVIQDLREHFHATAARNLFLTGELLGVLHLLQYRGIPALPFKGPALAAALYGNLTLREFLDLDLLVHPQDVLAAKAALLSAGFDPSPPLTELHEAALLRSGYEYDFYRRDQSVSVEVHWKMAPEFFSAALQQDRWWKRAATFSLAGTQVLTFSPQDLVLVLGVHVGRHGWDRLFWIVDLAEFLRTYPRLDWNDVLDDARQARVERILLIGLCLAHDLLQAPLPSSVRERIEADARIESLAKKAARHMLRTERSQLRWTGHWLVARDSAWDGLRYLVAGLLTPTTEEFSARRMPALLFPLYSLLRAFRKIGEYTLEISRRRLVAALRPGAGEKQ